VFKKIAINISVALLLFGVFGLHQTIQRPLQTPKTKIVFINSLVRGSLCYSIIGQSIYVFLFFLSFGYYFPIQSGNGFDTFFFRQLLRAIPAYAFCIRNFKTAVIIICKAFQRTTELTSRVIASTIQSLIVPRINERF